MQGPVLEWEREEDQAQQLATPPRPVTSRQQPQGSLSRPSERPLCPAGQSEGREGRCVCLPPETSWAWAPAAAGPRHWTEDPELPFQRVLLQNGTALQDALAIPGARGQHGVVSDSRSPDALMGWGKDPESQSLLSRTQCSQSLGGRPVSGPGPPPTPAHISRGLGPWGGLA